MKDVKNRKIRANRVETVPAATAQFLTIILEITATMLFPTTTTASSRLTRAPATPAPALTPVEDAAAALTAKTLAVEPRAAEPPTAEPQRPKQLQQGAQIPRPPPASPEDDRNTQTLAANAPEPRNAVKGSQPGTRMAKPRFKAVRATIEVNHALAATAANAPTTTLDTVTPPSPSDEQGPTPCSTTS